jgi:hypothetical protein
LLQPSFRGGLAGRTIDQKGGEKKMTIAITNRRAIKSAVWDVIAMLTLALHSTFVQSVEKENIKRLIKDLEKAMVGR